jgi:Cu-Zn family superoxide dismutase
MSHRYRTGFTAAFALALSVIACAVAQADGMVAKAQIVSCADPTKTLGTAVLREQPSEEGVKLVRVSIDLNEGALTPGKHAVHIHEVGSCTPCSAAGGHFDPGPSGNSVPDANHPFHSGDLINVNVGVNGSGKLRTTTSRVTVSPGPLSVMDADGSAIIIHDGTDTYCPDGDAAGCAGGTRAACGVLQVQSP